MPANRALIHVSKTEEFKGFLTQRGWTIEAPQGEFEVVRARHPKVKTPVIFHKRDRTDHLTCMFGLPATLAEQFIKQQRLARRTAARADEAALANATYERPHVKLFMPTKQPAAYGNIMWSTRHAARNGVFPSTHPVAPQSAVHAGSGNRMLGDSTPLERFRAKGYWASCFPEGDGICFQSEANVEQVVADIRECFGFDVEVARA